MNLPTLYALSSTGKVKVWSIRVEATDVGENFIITEHGVEGGKMQQSSRHINRGKNIGKANETTPLQQAESEARSKWEKQKTAKGYVEDKAMLGYGHKPRPMLAHPYEKKAHTVKWPAYVQPKLNGIRCLAEVMADGDVVFHSRGGKTFDTLDHLKPAILEACAPGDVLDGELFTEELTFQQITSAVKRAGHPDVEKIEYHVYDVVLEGRSMASRSNWIECYCVDIRHVRRVPTALVGDEKAMRAAHARFVQQGYEGTIVRMLDGEYRQGHRSNGLLKVKDFIDAEFPIVDGRQGTGKDAGTVIFTCETPEGHRFDCRPRGTHEQRTEWFDHLEQLIGTPLTVRYQTLSDDGIPIFPVGVNVRDYE